ncbi:MAG: hypothetical protein ACK5JT_16430, partial [Hyphomicrobiaceae bacterium]
MPAHAGRFADGADDRQPEDIILTKIQTHAQRLRHLCDELISEKSNHEKFGFIRLQTLIVWHPLAVFA